ncbi:MAG: hypothetical protein ACTSYO_03605 [Candidatus Ranarchaeia archaeon]
MPDLRFTYFFLRQCSKKKALPHLASKIRLPLTVAILIIWIFFQYNTIQDLSPVTVNAQSSDATKALELINSAESTIIECVQALQNLESLDYDITGYVKQLNMATTNLSSAYNYYFDGEYTNAMIAANLSISISSLLLKDINTSLIQVRARTIFWAALLPVMLGGLFAFSLLFLYHTIKNIQRKMRRELYHARVELVRVEQEDKTNKVKHRRKNEEGI